MMNMKEEITVPRIFFPLIDCRGTMGHCTIKMACQWHIFSSLSSPTKTTVFHASSLPALQPFNDVERGLFLKTDQIL